MSLPEGATIQSSELKRVADAIEVLKKDNHAPSSVTVTVNLTANHAYPKVVYRGEGEELQMRRVENEVQHEAAIAEGFGVHPNFRKPAAEEQADAI